MKLLFGSLLGLLVTGSVNAATTDVPQAVPALDGPNLLILALVLSAFAIRHMKSRK